MYIQDCGLAADAAHLVGHLSMPISPLGWLAFLASLCLAQALASVACTAWSNGFQLVPLGHAWLAYPSRPSAFGPPPRKFKLPCCRRSGLHTSDGYNLPIRQPLADPTPSSLLFSFSHYRRHPPKPTTQLVTKHTSTRVLSVSSSPLTLRPNT